MISLVYDVKRYRSLLAENVRDGDVVVELGPHQGASTKPYLEKAKLVVGVDKAEQARKRFYSITRKHDNVRFVHGDARGFDAMKETLTHTKACDVLAVDSGGGRHADTVFKVWATWSGTFKPRDSIIRCRALSEFVSRTEIDDPKLKRDFPDSGWLSTWGRATPYQLRKQLEEFKHWIDIDKPLE